MTKSGKNCPRNVTKAPLCVHLYAGKRSIDEVKTTTGKLVYLLNLPYFFAGKVKEYVQWLMEEKGVDR